MKKISYLGLFFSFILLGSSCSVIDQNIKARKSLAKCKYKVKKVKLERLNFGNEIKLDSKTILHPTSKKSIKKILRFLNQIRKKRFKVAIKSADLVLKLEIKNTSSYEVALDHIFATVYLDKRKFTSIKHPYFVRIPKGQSLVEPLQINVPFHHLNRFSFKPKTATIEATVYVNIIIGSYTLKTPYTVTLNKTVVIPYKKIQSILQKKKDKLLKKILKNAKKFLKRKVKKGIFKKVKRKFF